MLRKLTWSSVLITLALISQPSLVRVEAQDQEEGKPLSCDNHKQTAAAHRCHCARDEQECHGGMPPKPADVEMDKRRLTYCKAQHCQCVGHGCTS
jgi:hypothetical protein